MKNHTALLLVGHGTTGREDPSYLLLREELRSFCPATYLVMLHGSPSLQEVLPELKRQGIKTALLYPLFFSPATHLTRDVLSEDSLLRSSLFREGIRTRPMGEGLLLDCRFRSLLEGRILEAIEEG